MGTTPSVKHPFPACTTPEGFQVQDFMFSPGSDANQHTIPSCSEVVLTVFFSAYFLDILLIKLLFSYISLCHNF